MIGAWRRRCWRGIGVAGCVGLSMWMGAVPALVAQDVVVEKTEEEQQAPPELDLNTVEFVALQKEYRAAVQAVTEPHRQALNSFIDKHIAIADKMYSEGKRSGNIRDMGVARDYQKLFAAAREKVAETGNFELPQKIRRELEPMLEKARKEKEEVDAPIAPQLAEVEKEMMGRFQELVAARAATLEVEFPEALVAEKRKEFKEKDLIAKQAPNAAGGIAGEGGGGGELAVPEQNLGPILASSGEGLKWVKIARWTGDMMGMDVITLECGNQQRDYAENRFNPMAGADSKTNYLAITPMPPNPNYVYRLKRISGYTGIDQVLEWPSEKNRWRLVFRVNPLGDMVPEKIGFDFEVSLPESELTKVFGPSAIKEDSAEDAAATAAAKLAGKEERTIAGEDPKADAGKIKVRVVTKPAGVLIYVDDVLQVDRKSRRPLLSPCDVLALPGAHAIRLEKTGFIGKEFKEFTVQPGKRVNWELMADPAMVVKMVPLKANVPDWMATGVTVKAGDSINVQASGVWSCGDKRDRCGPEGLPNDKRHYKYYSSSENDLRQKNTIPYGALLVRIGTEGDLRAVGPEGLTFKADIDGEVMLDINELSGKDRKNNAGKLDVTVVAPAQP